MEMNTSKILFDHFDVVHTFGRMSNIALLMFSKIPKIVSYQLPPTIPQVKKAVKFARQHSIQFTGCSNYISNQIRPFGNVNTIYNGIIINDYHFQREVDLNAPLIFLGRIQFEKGTHIAIEVAKRTNRDLIIAGNIPNEEIHQSYFKEYIEPFIDGQRIKYVGAVNDQEKNKLLGKSSALLMPVNWDEPFGIVMVEALACGTPVLGFKRGALPEVVEDDINGFLCTNTEEMIDAVNKIPQISRAKCRYIAQQKFDSNIISKQYENLYLNAINNLS